ncbi:hypothetical protein [Candidatus Palauibacter sp.]|uniref:hypothetical protein n=2 Tax=Candidatus Palauibacter sp. TaxID=3101350 RepID=UPI003B01E8D9
MKLRHLLSGEWGGRISSDATGESYPFEASITHSPPDFAPGVEPPSSFTGTARFVVEGISVSYGLSGQ